METIDTKLWRLTLLSYKDIGGKMQKITEKAKKIYQGSEQGYNAFIRVSDLFNFDDLLLYPSSNLYPDIANFPRGTTDININGENNAIEEIKEDIAEIKLEYITQDKLIGNLGYKLLNFKLFNASKYKLADKKLTLYIGMKDLKDNVVEYKIGDFKVIDTPKQDIKKDEIEIKAQDYTYIMEKKIDMASRLNFPTTIKAIIEDIGKSLSMNTITENIANLDYIVYKAPYYKDGTISELLKQIAEATASNVYINNKNEIVFKSINQNADVELTKADILELNKTEIENLGYDRLVLSRIKIDDKETTDDLYFPEIKEEEKEKLNNQTEYKIISNYIIDDDRDGAIKGIYEKINNINYIGGNLEVKLAPFFEPFDILKIKNLEKDYIFYVFNYESEILKGVSKINTKLENKTKTEYKKATTRERVKNAELKVDKVAGEIKSVVSSVDEFNNELSSIKQNVEGINLWKEGAFNYIREQRDKKGKIILESASNNKILSFSLSSGIIFKDTMLYPQKSIFPSNAIYPAENITLNKITKNITISILGYTGNEETYIIKSRGLAYVDGKEEKIEIYNDGYYTIKRYITFTKDSGYIIEETEEHGKLEKEFKLFKGKNIINTNQNESNIYIKYTIDNPFTEATKAITKSELTINNEMMQSKLEAKTDKEEMTSLITQKNNELETKISKKVGKDEVISSINQTPESVKLNASKIQLEGVVTANGNFKILKDGSIETKNATINGDLITNNGIYVSYMYSEKKYSPTQNFYTTQTENGFHTILKSKTWKSGDQTIGYHNIWGVRGKVLTAYLPKNMDIREIYIFLYNEEQEYFEEKFNGDYDPDTGGYLERVTSGNAFEIAIYNSYSKKYNSKMMNYIPTLNYLNRVTNAWGNTNKISLKGKQSIRSKNLINDLIIEKIPNGQRVEAVVAPDDYNYTSDEYFRYEEKPRWHNDTINNILKRNGYNEVYMMVCGYLNT
jgi:hypothetical protein